MIIDDNRSAAKLCADAWRADTVFMCAQRRSILKQYIGAVFFFFSFSFCLHFYLSRGNFLWLQFNTRTTGDGCAKKRRVRFFSYCAKSWNWKSKSVNFVQHVSKLLNCQLLLSSLSSSSNGSFRMSWPTHDTFVFEHNERRRRLQYQIAVDTKKLPDLRFSTWLPSIR